MCQYIVDEAALTENIRIIKNLAKDVPVWAVLKGNGYGLGVTAMARRLQAEGISRFCVADAAEAQALRLAGFSGASVLMLQPTSDPRQLDRLLRLDVICTVSSWCDATALNAAAARAGRKAEAHIKVDTGMGRYGFLPEELDQIRAVYRQLPRIEVTGIYTHFSQAQTSYEQTRKQFRRFHYLVDSLIAEGIQPGQAHCCSSAAFLKYPEMRMDAVRIGSAFLGRMPYLSRFGLRRVGICEAPVEEIRVVEKGQRIGYGGAWRAARRTRLALVAVGWYHGFTVEYQRDCFRFRDCLRGCLGWVRSWFVHRRLWAEIGSCRCPVCGHTGMLYTAIDVTDCPCQVGDRVLLDISPVEQRGMEILFR